MNGEEAARLIKKGGIVICPTESFYAFGADATNARAVRKVFNIKGRGQSKPIALIAGNQRQVEKFFTMTKTERGLARRHWPGAVTLVLRPKAPTTPNPSSGRRGTVAADALLGTTPSGHSPIKSGTGHPSLKRRGRIGIGVRVPSHAQARALALSVGAPITATSANLSGRPPTKSARKVKRDFPGILIAPGRCGKYRQPSTVVAVKRGQPVVLRRGQVKI